MRIDTRMKPSWGIALLTVMMAATSTAPVWASDPPTAAVRAEPTPQEKETARALMDQGDELFEAKRFAEALKAFTGAHAIMRVPTTALEVAKTHEALNHLVEARDALMEAVRYPKSPNEPTAYTTAREDAERRAQALGERIPTVQIKVEGAQPGYDLHLSIDKVALPPAAALLPIKLNPGHHTVVVSSEATFDASQEIDLTERQNASIKVSLTARPHVERPAVASSAPVERRPFRTLGIAASIGGAVFLGVGTFFGLRASSKQDDAACPNNHCPSEAAAETLREANTAATISTIGFVAGAVLLAGGVSLTLFGPTTRTTAHLVPNGVVGTF